MPELLTRIPALRHISQDRLTEFGFKFKIERIEELRLGLEVGEHRPVRNLSSFRNIRRGRVDAFRSNQIGRCCQYRPSSFFASRARHYS